MKKAKLGSSSNANRDPYAKFAFEGTEACQKAFAALKPSGNKTMPLMSPEVWEEFCKNRPENA